MPRPFVFDIPSLAGGLNEASPEMIDDREVSVSDNFIVDGPDIVSRDGREEVAGTYSEDILSIFRYAPSFDESEVIILGCESSLAKVDGDSITALGVADGRIYPSSMERWWGEQYGDEFFVCQKGNGGVKRIYGSSALDAGIEAPATPPTAIDGGPGQKTAGKYSVAFRYYNTVTGARSNWSPLSKELEIADLRQILMSDITVSSNPQVNARQIGATKPDGGVLYLVGQINDNASTTFLENADPLNDYGEASIDVEGNITTDTGNRPPPDQAWALCGHKERLFVQNKDGVFWSEAGLWQSFKAASFLPGRKGTGLFSWELRGLVVFSEEGAKILQGDTPSDWKLDTLSKEHGTPAGKSAAVADGTLFWYTGVNIVASAGGAPAILPKIERIRTTLDSIPVTRKREVVGETIPSKGLYCLSVPTDDDTWVLIVYDYVRSAFEVFPDAPNALARLLVNHQEEAVYVAFEGSGVLYTFLDGRTDSGTAITATVRTKKFGDETRALYKLTRKVGVLTPAVAADCTLRVYHDDVVVATRTGISLRRKGWKRVAVNTSHQPGTHVQVEVEYAGQPALRIQQMQIEGVLIPARRTPTL